MVGAGAGEGSSSAAIGLGKPERSLADPPSEENGGWEMGSSREAKVGATPKKGKGDWK